MNKIILLATTALVFTSTSVFAASAQGPLTINAEIVQAATVTQAVPMNFGQIVAGADASTVVMTEAGVRAIGSGDAALVGGNGTGGSVTITGPQNVAFSKEIATEATLTGPGGATMTVDPIVVVGTNNFGAMGTVTHTIGGTLNVAADQAAGAYTGTWLYKINY